jgi:hypothetical protein
MKYIYTILFLLLSFRLLAPATDVIYIKDVEPINYYEPLISAVVWVESRGDNNAINFSELACGPFQIRQIRVDHYNQLTGKSYTLDDCFDYEISKEIFMYFAQGKSYEVAARNWNGKWSLTENYWQKVENVLLSQN